MLVGGFTFCGQIPARHLNRLAIAGVREREFCIGSTFRMRPSQANAALANVFHYGGNEIAARFTLQSQPASIDIKTRR
jgi:hypothetical protein